MSSADVSIRSCPKRPARVGPAERLGENIVEVVDELRRAQAQVLERREAGALEQATCQDGEPNFDLVQPRAVARCVDEANPVSWVFQKCSARLLRLEDADLALGAELIPDTAATGDELDKRCGTVCVELIGDEINLRPGRTDRRADHLAGRDVEVCDQRQGAVADVFELDTFHQARPNGLGFMEPLERLHAGILVGAHHVRARGRKPRSVPVGVADVLDIGLVLLRVFALVLRGQPILAFVRSQVRLAKKRSPCRGEMLSTMPLLMASRASSGGVQCDTGTPLSAGDSHASAMIPVICSGVNFGGAPHRSSSVRIPMMSFSRSLSDAPRFSAATSARRALAHRWRQRRTRCRSIPSSSAWSSFPRPSADRRMMRHRSTSRCGAVLARARGSSTPLSLVVTVTVTDFLPTRSSFEDRDTMILSTPNCNHRLVTSAEDI